MLGKPASRLLPSCAHEPDTDCASSFELYGVPSTAPQFEYPLLSGRRPFDSNSNPGRRAGHSEERPHVYSVNFRLVGCAGNFGACDGNALVTWTPFPTTAKLISLIHASPEQESSI